MTEETRAGFVALIGEPNAGKSTLLNRMVGAKVSIVTHKVQTTRARIRGVAQDGASQLVFVDTPGLFAPKRRLDRAMVAAAWGGAGDAGRPLKLPDLDQAPCLPTPGSSSLFSTSMPPSQSRPALPRGRSTPAAAAFSPRPSLTR